MNTGEITRLVRPRFGPVVVVVDGAEWRSLPRAVVRALGLAEGNSYDLDRLREDAEGLMAGCALERGLYLTTARERSQAEVVRTLKRDGYADDTATAVVERLQEIGAVDDVRFAGALVRSLSGSRGYGRNRIGRSLRESGISDEIADAALQCSVPADEEPDRAVALANRLKAGARGSVPRLAQRLVRRGFAPEVAWSAARSVLGDEAQGADDAAP